MFNMAFQPETPYKVYPYGVSIDDELWFAMLKAYQRNVQATRALPIRDTDHQLFHLLNLGVFDTFDKPLDASVRAMRHSSAMMDQMWQLLEVERERVCLLVVPGSDPELIGNLLG
jgi:hypothetical protein